MGTFAYCDNPDNSWNYSFGGTITCIGTVNLYGFLNE